MSDILVVNRLQKSFGNLVAVHDLTFEVREGEILGVMGPNGAGKTTVFNLLTGILKPDGGDVHFKGRDITFESPSRRCRRGIGRTYQIPRPFEKMTVYENLLVSAVHGGGLREKNAHGEIRDILGMTGLMNVRNHLAGGLSLLDRKRLELSRAMASLPTLILLDEVAGGLTEGEAEEVMKIVKAMQAKGITIVWIEHILMMMSEGVDRLLVLTEGHQLNCGVPGEVMYSEEVLECYLGVEDDE